MKWTVSTKIGAGYAFALLLLAILGSLAYRNTTSLIDNTRISEHTYQVRSYIRTLLNALQETETGQRGYLIVGEKSYLVPYQEGLKNIDHTLEKLRNLTADNANQQRRLDQLDNLISGKLAELKQTIQLRQTAGFDAALKVVRTNQGKEDMDKIRQAIADMDAEEGTLLKQRNDTLVTSFQDTTMVIEYGVPAAFVLLALAGYLIAQSISRQLKESIAQLATSSSEILATTTQIAAGAAETATAVSETSATVEEVKQTAQLASQKARSVSDTAQKAAQVSQSGRKSVEDAVAGMQRIQEQMESIAESIVRLSEQSQTIGEIIASVNDLAEQSNVLAVNAAIEAAKAGEHGKGFAVVAQEVKSLAEQSKQATTQVRAILGDIQKATSSAVLATEQGHKAVEAGMKQSTDAGNAIRLLADSIGEATQAATQIAASSQQQMVGMDQVALAINNIKSASAQNAAGTRQAEEAARGLHQIGVRLGNMIGNTVS